jgi:2-dehydropantoate 2-reductase
VPSIAVLGPGGVGGLVAAALAHAGQEVTVIARPQTAAVIARHGISVQSARLGEFVARPQAETALRSPVDFVLVATKATTLESALDRLEAQPRLVVPLLNGLDHLASLRARFGSTRVAAGVIRIESDRPSPGHIVQTSPFVRVDLAADDPILRNALEELREALVAAQIPTMIGTNEAQVMWSKLVRLEPLALTTSASGQPIGYIRRDPHWRAVLETAIAETVAVANAEGASIDSAETLAELDDAHPTLSSSMHRDLLAGRPPELDAIPGAVLRAAQRHGLRCPTVQRLVAQIEQQAASESS